jgi:hypothetical protein
MEYKKLEINAVDALQSVHGTEQTFAAIAKDTTAFCLRGFSPNWRPEQESNLRPSP